MSVPFGLRGRWVLAVLGTVAFEALMVTKPGSRQSFTVADELLLALAGLVAGTASLVRGRRERGREHRGWGRLGTGCLLFAAGQVAFGVQVVVSGPAAPSGSSPGDVLTVLGIPVAVAGLVAFAGPSLTSRLVTALDATTIGVAFLFVSWALVLGPVYRTSGTSAEEITSLVYVGGSLALLALVLVLAMRWYGDGQALVLLGIAFAWISASNAAYGVTTLRDSYQTGDWRIDVGWFASFLLIALAATRAPAEAGLVDVRRRWLLTLFVPYASVLLVAATSAGILLTGHRFDAFLEVTGIVVVLLLLARYVRILRDHHSLTLDLERRVGERTASEFTDVRLRALLRDSSDVIAVLDPEGVFTYASPATWRLVGQPAEYLLGRHVQDLVHPMDRAAVLAVLDVVARDAFASEVVTFRLAGPHGRWRHVEATVSALLDDEVGPATVLNLRDVSERAARQEELRHQASHDPLTSLANRRVFDDRLRHALDRAGRTGEALSVIFLDLDHFKHVNDTAGHAVGDQLLVEVAHRLRTCLRPSDTAARLGGDEFAVLLEETDAARAHEVASRVVAALAPPYELGEQHLTVTASVGVTSTEGGESSDLLRDADVAMYEAKAHGRDRVEVFEPTMYARLREQRDLESRLRGALERHEMRLRYQPMVDLRSGRVTGLEALLRWELVPGEELLPGQFLPLAEERGLVQDLDRWMLLEAAGQVRSWQRTIGSCQGLRVHVNLSAVDLREPHVAERLTGILEATGLAAACLVLEINETAVLADPGEVAEVLQQVRDLGVGVCLDDFGTGYASLATLQRLPLDGLKVDRSFVSRITSGPSGERLVAALLDMAHALGLDTVAEAVESPEQEAWLRSRGCVAVQGLLYAPPLTADEAGALLLRAPTLLRTAVGEATPDAASDAR